MLRDLTDAEARAALPLKWGAVPEGTIPAWVAEMDLAPAPALLDAVQTALARGVTGYAPFGDGGVGAAFAGFASRHWGWAVPAEATVVAAGVVPGIRLALDVLAPPGPVVVPLPCYPPFRDVVALAGREAIHVETDPDEPDAPLDLAQVERAFAAGAGALLLCNPHNPLGRVPRRPELEALRDLAAAYGARVLSDEIHAPLVLPGGAGAAPVPFTPYLDVDPTGILLTSHTKSFNAPGLPCAQVVVLDEADRAALRSVPPVQNHGCSPLGQVAAVAAWTASDPWLASLVDRIAANRDLLAGRLAAELPAARLAPLEATYLAWLDLRACGPAAADPATAAARHGLRVGDGGHYHPGLPGHARLNIATSPERLGRIVDRLVAAVGPEGDATPGR